MQKKVYKYLIIAAIVLVVIYFGFSFATPKTSGKVWWNPFSWGESSTSYSSTTSPSDEPTNSPTSIPPTTLSECEKKGFECFYDIVGEYGGNCEPGKVKLDYSCPTDSVCCSTIECEAYIEGDCKAPNDCSGASGGIELSNKKGCTGNNVCCFTKKCQELFGGECLFSNDPKINQIGLFPLGKKDCEYASNPNASPSPKKEQKDCYVGGTCQQDSDCKGPCTGCLGNDCAINKLECNAINKTNSNDISECASRTSNGDIEQQIEACISPETANGQSQKCVWCGFDVA